MLSRHNKEIQEIVDAVAKLTVEFEEGIGREDYADEEDITSKFTQSLQGVLNFNSIEFSVASKLVTLKKHTEEPHIGADFMVVLSFVSPELSQTKGLLVQAKRKEYGKNFRGEDFQRLQEQCQKMITYTPESFVLTYSSQKMRVHRAYVIEALDGEITRSIDDACHMSVPAFFRAFLKCYNGDPVLNFNDFNRLNYVLESTDARSVLLVSAVSTAERKGSPSKEA